MVYYPDEFGYWANAAGWIGLDWSSLTALGSYYSFGYSLLLAPILKFCPDSVTAYRTAVGLNMLLQGACILPLCGICRRLFPGVSKRTAACAAGIGLFYPAWIFYGMTTLAEGLIFFLYMMIVYLFLLLMEEARMGRMLCLMGALLYMCFVHMRTAGVSAAAILVLLCWLWREPAYRKRMLVGFGLLAAGGALGIVLRHTVVASVYRDTGRELLAANDMTGQLARALAVCTREGLARFLCGCAGKLFYLGAASFGLVYYALYVVGRNSCALVRKMRRKKPVFAREWASLFLLLSFAGQFLITAVYLNRPNRGDEVVYGRYNDYLLPVFMGIGFMAMRRCRNLGMHTAAVLALQSVLMPAVWQGEKLYGGDQIQGYFMAGLGYLVDDLHFDAVPDMAGIFLFSNLLILLFSITLWIGRDKRMTLCATALIIFMEIAMGIGLHHKYTYRFNDMVYRELQLADYIGQSGDHTPITYVYGGDIPFIDVIQFYLPEREIDVVEEAEIQEISGGGGGLNLRVRDGGRVDFGRYLILDTASVYRERVEAYCAPCRESAYFVLYDLGE